MGNSIIYDTNLVYNVSSFWMIFSAFAALIGGTFLYLFISNKKYVKDFTGWKAKLVDFLNFKTLMGDTLLKLTYTILAMYITLSSFSYISQNFALFIVYLILGNVFVRLAYEFLLVLLNINKNTNEINEMLSKNNSKKKDEKEEEKKKEK
jgi:hypothetical protein